MARIPFALLAFIVSTSAFADVRITSWNMKHLGRVRQDLNKVAEVLRDSDLVLLQEVNVSKTGAIALSRLAELASAKAGSTFCFAFSEIPTGAKERYGMIWREDKLAYVTTDGKVVDRCPRFAMTLRLGVKGADKIVREPAVGRFREAASGNSFWVATIHTIPTARNPTNEIPHVFDAALDIAGKAPSIVAGDFNIGCDDSSFKGAYEAGYKAAIPCDTKTSLKSSERAMSAAYDNILVRGAVARDAAVIDLHARFPGMSAKEVYNDLSDHAPVTATLSLAEPTAH